LILEVTTYRLHSIEGPLTTCHQEQFIRKRQWFQSRCAGGVRQRRRGPSAQVRTLFNSGPYGSVEHRRPKKRRRRVRQPGLQPRLRFLVLTCRRALASRLVLGTTEEGIAVGRGNCSRLSRDRFDRLRPFAPISGLPERAAPAVEGAPCQSSRVPSGKVATPEGLGVRGGAYRLALRGPAARRSGGRLGSAVSVRVRPPAPRLTRRDRLKGS
jgi:hypothetical protein